MPPLSYRILLLHLQCDAKFWLYIYRYQEVCILSVYAADDARRSSNCVSLLHPTDAPLCFVAALRRSLGSSGVGSGGGEVVGRVRSRSGHASPSTASALTPPLAPTLVRSNSDSSIMVDVDRAAGAGRRPARSGRGLHHPVWRETFGQTGHPGSLSG